MPITPREMLDTSVAQLETLVAFIGEQLGEGTETGHDPEDVGACKEILGCLRTLLRSVRTRQRYPTELRLRAISP